MVEKDGRETAKARDQRLVKDKADSRARSKVFPPHFPPSVVGRITSMESPAPWSASSNPPSRRTLGV